MKKIISLLACVAMLAMIVPLGAMAESSIVTYTEDFTSGDLVRNNGKIELNAAVGISTMTVVDIAKEGLTLTGNSAANVSGNVLKIAKTGNADVQYFDVIPSVAGLCNAKNYTLEFDFIPVGFSGNGQIALYMGAKYVLQANNGGSSISKLSVNGSTATNMSKSGAFTAMSAKSTVKISIKDGSLASLAINGYEIAADTPASSEGWSFNRLRIQMNRSTTGTLYIDNFKLTLLDDYLLSSSHDGEKFNVNYFVKDAAKLFKVSYGSDGMLKGVTIDALAASATEEITSEAITAASDVSSMKFFIWNDNLVPLVNSASATK